MHQTKRRILLFCLGVLLAIGLSSCTILSLSKPVSNIPSRNSSQHQTAPLFDGLGTHTHPISTQEPLTQRYFNQGLNLIYGFNYAEAIRSFRQAAQLDPDCAMCYWGIALSIGSINRTAADTEMLLSALQILSVLVGKVNEPEQAYIQALINRYTTTSSQQSSSSLAFANAMRDLMLRYPEDLDAATLFAKALMEAIPWDYWDENGNLNPQAKEVISTLESVIQREPNHHGANHLYIHAVERERPELGVAAADRISSLRSGSGHLVHMPSHIYMQVGRYDDAVVSNQNAIAADADYFRQCHKQGSEAFDYMPYHNQHFLWSAALMTGQMQIAMTAANHVSKGTAQLMDELSEPHIFQDYFVLPLYTFDRFGQWEKILTTPAPNVKFKYATGVWHYVRGKAFASLQQLDQATQELEQLQALLPDAALHLPGLAGKNSMASLLNIATEVLQGEIAAKQGEQALAIAYLKKAVHLEDALAYTEPADWYLPTRQRLGAVLLDADRPTEAEQVYREDLAIHPENGWSLQGLARSLKAQGKINQAQAVQRRLSKAWQGADITIDDIDDIDDKV
jgi:tetratricopeptide (TPR) repeat protein